MPKQALSHCAEQLRSSNHDRFLCTLFAPPDRREALTALFALDIEISRIPETVTEPLMGQIRLQWWRDSFDAAFDGRPPSQPVFAALAAPLTRGDVARDLLTRYFEAWAESLWDEPPATLEALTARSQGTSGTLERLALGLLGVADAVAETAAERLGTARGLVEVIRGVAAHKRRGWSGLPADLRRAAGLEGQRAATPTNPNLPAVVRPIAERARDLLSEARQTGGIVPNAALPVLLMATSIGAELRALAAAGHHPARLPPLRPRPGRMIRLLSNRIAGRY